MDDALIKRLWDMGPVFVQGAPHSKRLGFQFVSVDKGRATLSLPYNKALIGDPKTGVIHGGAVTTLLDQTAGLAAIAGFDELRAVATLSLTIDYMRAAKPGETIIASAECYKATRHVAFVRGVAHEGDEDNPVATCQATFMATSQAGKDTEDSAQSDPQTGEAP